MDDQYIRRPKAFPKNKYILLYFTSLNDILWNINSILKNNNKNLIKYLNRAVRYRIRWDSRL